METPVILTPSTTQGSSLSRAKSFLSVKPHYFTNLILSCALFLVFTASALTQQPLSLADAASQGQFIYEQSGVTGMVLVVVRNREVMIKGYGETYPGSGHPPDSTSIVRLCSVSKILTTDLLQKLVADGKLSLTDPLQNYAPPGLKVPLAIKDPAAPNRPTKASESPITLLDLATHTAGLSREVSSYPRKTPHFTFPDLKFRWDWLPKQKLLSTPGTAAAYSNIGFDLLGDALASASGESYATLLHDRLLQPLNMWDTTLFPSADQCARLMQGSEDEGPCTSTEQSGASGGVYSTPADMAKLLQYLLHTPNPIPNASPLASPALTVYLDPSQLKSVQGISHAGDPTGIGLAWIQIGDPTSPSVILEKTGGGAGFTTYIALSPDRRTGIFLAATEGKGKQQIDFYHEANNLLAALANVPPLPPRVRPAPAAKKHPKRRVRPAAHPQPKA
ncbi:MAG: D-alanyl-D-alanine-carboxypeptidase/endopeptidase AmpH [Terracidiphilus sp.]|jgi:D-alanyl-D-alanine-carboxypeptidase/D-alanyl-D-alanine-endopeptidase